MKTYYVVMLCNYDSAYLHNETFPSIELAKLWIENQTINLPDRGFIVHWITTFGIIEVYKEFY